MPNNKHTAKSSLNASLRGVRQGLRPVTRESELVSRFCAPLWRFRGFQGASLVLDGKHIVAIEALVDHADRPVIRHLQARFEGLPVRFAVTGGPMTLATSTGGSPRPAATLRH